VPEIKTLKLETASVVHLSTIGICTSVD
jgi:hypothetical protein